MEERSELSKSVTRANKNSASHSRKSGNKKRAGRKSHTAQSENWCEKGNPANENGGPPPAMDYPKVFWPPPPHRSGVASHLQTHNGQRLFAAVSDPSVCGYSPLPMAYAMEPIAVPPIYQPLYHPPIARPNYRTLLGRPRRNLAQNQHILPQTQAALTNGYSSLQENRSHYSNPPAYQNGDYASLPPNANNDRANNCAELNSEHRRYSDPGLGPADSTRSPDDDEDSDSGESGSSVTTIGKNKLVLSLVEQMTALRETNSQMFKELHETRTDLENVKCELARLKRSGMSDYQPGMLSDIVRDMREANKVLDEAMMTKVNAMVDEQNRQRTMEFEKLRDQLSKMAEEKDDTHRRIAKLEETVAALKLNANDGGREIAAFEEETLSLRRELQEARASRNIAENHVAKLEKLVEILRKKMNGASNEETVAHIRELVTSGINQVVGGKLSADNIEEILRSTKLRDVLEDETDERGNGAADANEDDDYDEDDAISSCDPDSADLANSRGRNFHSTNDSTCSNNSLIGPVTDL